MKIYVVMQILGDYSDATYSALAAYRTLEEAQRRVTDEARSLRELRSREHGRASGLRYPPEKSAEEIELYGDRYESPESCSLYIEETELL